MANNSVILVWSVMWRLTLAQQFAGVVAYNAVILVCSEMRRLTLALQFGGGDGL
jgi:hypothetical protein